MLGAVLNHARADVARIRRRLSFPRGYARWSVDAISYPHQSTSRFCFGPAQVVEFFSYGITRLGLKRAVRYVCDLVIAVVGILTTSKHPHNVNVAQV